MRSQTQVGILLSVAMSITEPKSDLKRCGRLTTRIDVSVAPVLHKRLIADAKTRFIIHGLS